MRIYLSFVGSISSRRQGHMMGIGLMPDRVAHNPYEVMVFSSNDEQEQPQTLIDDCVGTHSVRFRLYRFTERIYWVQISTQIYVKSRKPERLEGTTYSWSSLSSSAKNTGALFKYCSSRSAARGDDSAGTVRMTVFESQMQ